MSDLTPSRLESLTYAPLEPDDEQLWIKVAQNPHEPSAHRERAWESLISGHHRAIRAAAARGVVGMADSPDQRREALREMFCVAVEAFHSAVLEHDLASEHRLSTHAYPAMRFAILAEMPSKHGVAIPKSAIDHYVRVMQAHGNDFGAAYAAAQLGGQGISAAELMTVHRAVGPREDADVVLGEENDEYLAYSSELTGSGGNMSKSYPRDLRFPPVEGMPSEVDVSTLRAALGALPPWQQDVMRLHFGFRDEASEATRAAYGLRPGSKVSDRDIAVMLESSRSAVQRWRTAGLEKMRSALAARDENDN